MKNNESEPKDPQQIDEQFLELVDPIRESTEYSNVQDIKSAAERFVNDANRVLSREDGQEMMEIAADRLAKKLTGEHGIFEGAKMEVTCKVRPLLQLSEEEIIELGYEIDGEADKERFSSDLVEGWSELGEQLHPSSMVGEDEKGRFLQLNAEVVTFLEFSIDTRSRKDSEMTEPQASITILSEENEILYTVDLDDLYLLKPLEPTIRSIREHVSYYFPELYKKLSILELGGIPEDEKLAKLKGLEIKYDEWANPKLKAMLGDYITHFIDFDKHDNEIAIDGSYQGVAFNSNILEVYKTQDRMIARPEKVIVDWDQLKGEHTIILAVSKLVEDHNKHDRNLYFIPINNIESMTNLRDKSGTEISEVAPMLSFPDQSHIASYLKAKAESSTDNLNVMDKYYLMWEYDHYSGSAIKAVHPGDIQTILSVFEESLVASLESEDGIFRLNNLNPEVVAEKTSDMMRESRALNSVNIRIGDVIHIKDQVSRFLIPSKEGYSIGMLGGQHHVVGDYSQLSAVAMPLFIDGEGDKLSDRLFPTPVIVLDNAKIVGESNGQELQRLGTVLIAIEDGQLSGFYKQDGKQV